MAQLLDGVSGIDWRALRHAYGSAEKVPLWLAAMTDPATSDSALDALHSAVYHQGGAVYTAGAAVVPFLVRFAMDPAVPGRSGVLELLGRFAALHSQMREPYKSKPSARQCRAALLAAVDDLVTLLDDPDPAIRRHVVDVLVKLGERADHLADELTRRFPGEREPEVAADYLLALGTAGPFTPAKRTVVAAWLTDHTPPPGDQRRLTFLVARYRLGDGGVTTEEILAAYDGAVPERVVGWLGRELGADRTAGIAVARIGIGQALRTREDRPLAEAGTAMRRWRSAAATLVAEIATTLDGPPEVQASGVHLLAVTGDAGRPWTEDVAALIGSSGRTKASATWALARWGDRRAVAVVERSLRRDPEIFGMGSGHYTDEFYWLTQGQGITDVCLPLTGYADDLVPAVRWRLRNDPATPTMFQLTELLAAYGPAAAAAMPELTAMLDTHPELACAVLAELGPAAAAAQPGLARLATSAGRTADTAAWALFRITGDPEPFLAREDLLPAADRISGPAVRKLGDLGPLAARYEAGVEQRLTAEPRMWPTWGGVELGFAHYRITGDPALCLAVFDKALDPLRHDRQLPVSRRALLYLARIGPAAAVFRPLLQEAITQDERLLYSGGWRGITEDEEARSLAIQALAAIAP